MFSILLLSSFFSSRASILRASSRRSLLISLLKAIIKERREEVLRREAREDQKEERRRKVRIKKKRQKYFIHTYCKMFFITMPAIYYWTRNNTSYCSASMLMSFMAKVPARIIKMVVPMETTIASWATPTSDENWKSSEEMVSL